MNKFFYKNIGKKHKWIDRLIWTENQWIDYVSNKNVKTFLFKYKEDLAGFKKDLKEIDPLLDELFDFEEKLIQTANSDPETFKKSGSYLYLRAGLRDRWNVLDEHNDYPHMLKPLKIDL